MSYSSYKIGKNTVRCKDTQTGISYTVDFNRPVKTYFISGDNITGTLISGEDGPVISFREVTYDIKTGRTVDSNCWTEPNYDFERKQNYSRSKYDHDHTSTISNDVARNNNTKSYDFKDFMIMGLLMYVAIKVLERI